MLAVIERADLSIWSPRRNLSSFGRTDRTCLAMNNLNSRPAFQHSKSSNERIISIKGEYEQQIRALETIYAKLCQANESDNARILNYSSQQYYQQQQLMQHFAQQAAMMAAASGGTAQPLLTSHYPQQQQQPQASVVHQSQSNNSNGSSNKFLEQQQQQQQQPSTNAIYHPSYYVRFVSRITEF